MLRRQALDAIAAQVQLEKSIAEEEVASLAKQFEAAKEDFEALSVKASETVSSWLSPLKCRNEQYEDMLGRLNNATYGREG